MPRFRSGMLPLSCTQRTLYSPIWNAACICRLGQSHANEGFFADPQIGGGGPATICIHAVGIANNVNYGAKTIAASITRLDQLACCYTGAGANLAAARAPVIIARNGLRVGVVQRSSVYWPTDHEAHADSPGIAVIRGHTAYHVPTSRIAARVSDRSGVPPLHS